MLASWNTEQSPMTILKLISNCTAAEFRSIPNVGVYFWDWFIADEKQLKNISFFISNNSYSL